MKRMNEDFDNGNNWDPGVDRVNFRNWDGEQRSMKYHETKICSECKRRAVWFYGPCVKDAAPGPYCETHIRRGCSCNYFDGHEHLDPLGREWPCSDWEWRPGRFWTWVERHLHSLPWRKRKLESENLYEGELE